MKLSKIDKKMIREDIYNVGILLLTFIFLNIVVTTIFQIINIAMSPINLILASIISIIVFLFFRKNNENKGNVILSIIITVIISIAFTYCIGKIFDISYDGSSYHKIAIGLIKEGWNPLYTNCNEFCKENDSELENSNQFLWIEHYPKATWNFAASIYSITNNIESGKVLIIMLVVSIICISYYYL